MEIPKIKKSKRSREFSSYDSQLVNAVVYEYLFNGLSHRESDRKVLHMDDNYSRGYQSMGILHYLGLRNDFKGIFAGLSVEQAIDKLAKAGDVVYQELISILSSLSGIGCSAFSWSILSPTVAIKKMDKSVFDYNGSGIPTAITPFFHANHLENGERVDIVLAYEEIEYEAHIIKEMKAEGRVRMFWKTNLTDALISARDSINEAFPFMVFEYIQNNKYHIKVESQSNQVNEGFNKMLQVIPLADRAMRENAVNSNGRSVRKNRIDYIAKAKRDKDLGFIGEIYTLNYEKDKLLRCYLSKLSERVRHISEEEGDGAGYDIQSYDEQGNTIYIEVKTTKGDYQDQFFLSVNELAFAHAHPTEFYLYRVYDIMNEPKVTIYTYDDLIKLQFNPTQYFVKAISSTEEV